MWWESSRNLVKMQILVQHFWLVLRFRIFGSWLPGDILQVAVGCGVVSNKQGTERRL